MKDIVDFFKKLFGKNTEKTELNQPTIEAPIEILVDKKSQNTVYVSPEITTWSDLDGSHQSTVKPKKAKTTSKKAPVKKQTIKKKK